MRGKGTSTLLRQEVGREYINSNPHRLREKGDENGCGNCK